MRPRGFSITQHAKTMVDSTGMALLALRRQDAVDDAMIPTWAVEVFLSADGRHIKTLQLPDAFQQHGADQGVPSVDVVRLYGVDFLVLADPAARTVRGWRLKLQTAEQVCSMEQMGAALDIAAAKADSCSTSCFDILYQVLSKFTMLPALASSSTARVSRTTQLTVLGPACADESDKISNDLRQYIHELIHKLRQDTQKPSLEDLKLEAWAWFSETC